jgi:glucan phosphorylase
MVEFVRRKTVTDRLARGEPIPYVEAAARPSTRKCSRSASRGGSQRTSGWTSDPGCGGPWRCSTDRGGCSWSFGQGPPSDDGAKRLVQRIFELKDVAGATGYVAFLEDYDLEVARQLVAGCDVWLNLPRAPLEASGTSGMKAALNGGLNLSVLDGWWPEAYDGSNGWALSAEGMQDDQSQDARDATRLYEILETEVVPSFHERDPAGVPVGWVRRIKASLRTAGVGFTTARMMSEYVQRVYSPAEPARH